MVDYWILANAFSTHCWWWTSSFYCWLTTPPLPIRSPPHLLCLGPSMCIAWWQMTATSLQGHPVLWDWRRWDRQVFVGSKCPHSLSLTLCVTVCPAFVLTKLSFTNVTLSSLKVNSGSTSCKSFGGYILRVYKNNSFVQTCPPALAFAWDLVLITYLLFYITHGSAFLIVPWHKV